MPVRADRLIEFLVSAIPLAAAILATITNLFNLWLAARIVKFSGRLARPWPQLSALRFPPLLTAALRRGRRLEFRRRNAWHRGRYCVGSLLLAYGVLGFAVLHAITQGLQIRPFLLGLAYAAVFLIRWPILASACSASSTPHLICADALHASVGRLPFRDINPTITEVQIEE